LLHDYRQFVPYLLSSLSLLINAIADDGYAVDIVNENMQNLWFWNLFFITDFIIMAGALVWYNKVHISDEIIKNEKTVRT
jgi:hypothetical protein